jgi:phosphoglycolate phosphatase
VPSDAQARHVIGLGLEDAMRHAVPDLPAAAHQGSWSSAIAFHYLSRDHELTLFDGIPQVLNDLKEAGHLLAVATGKSRLGLNRALEHSGLGTAVSVFAVC